MVSFLRKYRTRSLILLLAVIAAALITTLAVNTILFFSRKAIARSIEKYFPRSISIGACVYLPPWHLIFKDVTVSDPASSAEKPVLRIPSVQAKVSLLKLFTERKIFISGINVLKPRAAGYPLVCFVRDNYEAILNFIKLLPLQNIKFLIKELTVTLDESDPQAAYCKGDLRFIVKNGWLFSNGLIRQFSALGQGPPLRYKAKGFLTHDGMSISKLEIRKEDFYAQVWGNLKDNRLHWNGFMFINTILQENDYQEPGFGIFEELKDYLSGLRVTAPDSMLPQANLYLLDIDSQVTFAFPDIQLEKMNFSLNNNPMGLKGTISLASPPSLDLSATTYLRPLSEAVVENLKRIDLVLKGIVEQRMFLGQGLVSFNFVTKKSTSSPLQKAEVDLEGLSISLEKYPNLKTMAEAANFLFRTESNEYRVSLKQLQAFWYLAKERFKFFSFKSQLYDGALQGLGRLDADEFPPAVTAIARIQKVSANKLAGVMIHFSKVYGKLDSLMRFQTRPDVKLEGRMYVHSGILKNFEFFRWLADFLSLEALNKVDFTRALSRYTVSPEGATLHEIQLDAQDLGLGGYFTLGAGDKVTSRLSLQCSKELLRQSPKFSPLVRLIEADVSSVGFDFQLSGNLHNMNFLWLQSDFKRRLQKSIPNFIERMIEQNIEHFIESLSAN